MKILYYIVEAYPREAALKSIPLVEQLMKSLSGKGVHVELIIFSDTKLNSEKIGYLTSKTVSITGKEVRELDSADYFETIKSVTDAEKCYGVAALSSIFADDYIPRFASHLKKRFIGSCYKIDSTEQNLLLTKDRYNGQVSEDYIVNESGACFTLVAIKEGKPDSAKRVTEDDLKKAMIVKAATQFEKTGAVIQQHKNKKDIREYKSFIALSGKIKHTGVSEREAEIIAKNITGIKTGDSTALGSGIIDAEREISLSARTVNSSFLLNFGMNGLPCEINAVCSRGPVIFIGTDNRNLYSKFSDIIINKDPELFLIKFCEEIEKYPRY